MQHCNRSLMVPLVAAGLALAACHQNTAPTAKIKPATVEHVEGQEVSRITLTQRAAERLDIKTVTVLTPQLTRSGARRPVVPYAAVLYDAKGVTWVYTSPANLVYVRHRITVDYIEGDQAVLTDGPPAGTQVVTQGGQELFGAEFEIGH
jgi:hypothetical protein